MTAYSPRPTATAVALAALLATVAAVVFMPRGRVVSGHGQALATPHRSVSAPPAAPQPSTLPPLAEQAKQYTGGITVRPSTPLSHELHEEAENEENGVPTSTEPLIYHGGPVQTSPHVYLVLWGASWATPQGDPNGLANRLHTFYQGFGGSSVANVLTQYKGSTGSFTNSDDQYKGWLLDASPVPARPTTADMAAAAIRAATRIGDYNYNAQYVIATPWGVVDQYTLSEDACGWHNWTHAGPSWITYTSIPYLPYYATIGDHNCGAGSVTGSKLDGVTIVASHEYEESVNDPGLHSWYDVDGSENADKCAWTNTKNVTLANGQTFPVQTAWSNQFRTQYGNGCLYTH